MANATGLARVGTPEEPIRCAILISGSGSGMQAMLNHQSDANCSHYTALVISNKPDVAGIPRAQEFDIPVEVVEVPAIVNKEGLSGIKLENYPAPFALLLNNQVGTIELTTQAVLNKSRHSAYLAMLVDPVVDDPKAAERLLNTMIEVQDEYLGYLI